MKNVPTLRQAEDETVRRAMEVAGGNKSAAARLLGIDRKTLYSKLQRIGPIRTPSGTGKRKFGREAPRRAAPTAGWKLLEQVSGDPWPLVFSVCRYVSDGVSKPVLDDLHLENTEAKAVRLAMEAAQGNKSAAARLLGIDRKTLYTKLQRMSSESSLG